LRSPKHLSLVLALVPLVAANGAGRFAHNVTEARPQARSVYMALSANREVDGSAVLLATTLTLGSTDALFVEGDGAVIPHDASSAATLSVQVDGRRISNESSIDWRVVPNPWDVPVTHSFNVIGEAELASGRHLFQLVIDSAGAGATVAASSNLSVFVHPATAVHAAELPQQVGPFDFATRGSDPASPPHAPVESVPVNSSLPAVALASASVGSATEDQTSWGDAMMSIYADANHPGNARSSWSVQEMGSNELTAPVYAQAVLPPAVPHATVSLDVTEFPWFNGGGTLTNSIEDGVRYTIQPTAMLLVLTGGLRVFGAARTLATGHPDSSGTALDFYCLASSAGFPGCAPVGTDVLLTEARIRIPRSHPGVLFFAAKTRAQGDDTDAGGIVSIWLTIDGVRRGSTGTQQIAAPSGVSERTVSASYLSAGANTLKPGWHTVRLYGHADGSFAHLTLVRDIPLLWFD